MQIHLSNLAVQEGGTLKVSVPFEQKEISFQLGTFPVISSEPADLVFTNTGNKVLNMQGKASVTVEIPCSRCLSGVQVKIPVSFDEKIDLKKTEQERVADLDEIAYLTGMDLDVDRLVFLEVLMNWPPKVLCREDCRGICSRCGKNLNTGRCQCEEEPKDPRMAAIQDIFSKFKEV